MFDPTLLATLAAVLRTGSFDRAAAQLGVTPPAVSQRIKALEETVGTRLILRGAPCTGTEAGLRLARHAEDLALLNAAAARDLGIGATASTRVRIAVNADSLATWFLAALAPHSDLSFDLVVDDQDHSADWLHRGDVAAAVTGAGAAVPGCDCAALGALRYRAIASPAFAAQHFSGGLTAAAFRSAPAIIYNSKDRLQDRWASERAGEKVVLSGHFIPSTHGFVDAARLGLGWGMNPAALVDPLIAAGALVDLAPTNPLDLPLFWQVRRVTAGALGALTRTVRTTAARAALQA